MAFYEDREKSDNRMGSRYLMRISQSFYQFQEMMQSKLAMLPEYMLQEEMQQQNQPRIPFVRVDGSNQEMVDGAGGQQTQQDPRKPNQGGRERESSAHSQSKDSQKNKARPKPEVKQYTLDLTKREGSFGFSIVGGIELGGIFVKDVTPGGPAAMSRQINAGDRIVQINKDSFENVTRREAINTLRNAPEKSRFIMETFGQNLVIESDPSIVTPLADSVLSLAQPMPQIPVVQTERESEFIPVELARKDGSFGIGFTGGPELGGVYVKSLLPNGAAETDGRIAIGDKIIEIDQTKVEQFSRKKIHEHLKSRGNVAYLVFERYKQIPAAGGHMYIDREKVLRSSQNFKPITLTKKNDSLGFSITGGLDLGGVFVKYLNPNGPAAQDGRLEVGDRVVAVNDISLETATRQKTLEIIRNAASPVNLIIEKCVVQGGVMPGEHPEDMVNGNGNQIVRSDSIKSLPTNGAQRSSMGSHSRAIMYSMQNLPHVNANVAHDMNGGYKDHRGGEHDQNHIQDIFVVDLAKLNGSYGVSLIGGPEVGGIYVKAVQPGGAADQDGRMMKGDRVIEINARRMDGVSRAEAIDWLKSAERSTFILERFLPAKPGQQQQQQHPGQHPPPQQQHPQHHQKQQLQQHQQHIQQLQQQQLQQHIQQQMQQQQHQKQQLSRQDSHGMEHHQQQHEAEMQHRHNMAHQQRMMQQQQQHQQQQQQQMHQQQQMQQRHPHHQQQQQQQQQQMQHRQQHPQQLQQQQLQQQQLHQQNKISPNKMQHSSFDGEFVTVELRRKNETFGLSLLGGPELRGIFIKNLMTGGPAAANGKISKGDRLLEINGTNLDGLNRYQANDLLKQAPSTVTLLIEKIHNCEDVPSLDIVVYALLCAKVCTALVHQQQSAPVEEQQPPPPSTTEPEAVPMEEAAPQPPASETEPAAAPVEESPAPAPVEESPAPMTQQETEPPVQPVQQEPPKKDIYGVELRKGDSGFGFSVTGGVELGGIYVKGILPGGSADSTRKIVKGDRLLEVNGVSMEGLTKQQATDLLRKAPQIANLVLERHGAFDNIVIPESEYFTVELHKKANGYGLSLTGGPEIDGVYVKQVQRDSAADQDGRIKKGDRLITINGRNVEEATRQKCTEMLKLSQDVTVLHLERCVIGDDLPPLDTVLTVVELNKGENGYGIALTGGPEIGGIFIKALMPGGAAEKDGRILVGDRVVDMNSVPVDGFTRQQATELLKNSVPTATFVLERYKQRKHHIVSSTPSVGQISSEGASPTTNQHFSFPLYNGAAPSVPPRHHTNGIPSRESAFKRLEQQQMKLAAHAPTNVPQNPVRANPGTVLHNVQGSSVSGRIPSLIQRQHSLESTQTAMQKPYQEPNVPPMDPHAPPTTNLSLSLIETPVRKYINTNNETVDDSPQRFLKQFSKSVASSQSNAVQSRIPIGPISSAIFGNNRDSRNVHELHDLRENPLEMIEGLPELPPEMIAAARQYLENEANNENNNGPIYKQFYDPEASRELEVIEALRNAKGQLGQGPLSQTTSYIVSTGNSSVFDSYVTNGNTNLINPRLIKPKSIPHPGVNRDINLQQHQLAQQLQQQYQQHQQRSETIDNRTKMVPVDMPNSTVPVHNNDPVVHQLDMKKPVVGLKWMSLNDNETSSSGATPASLAGDSSAVSQLNDLKKTEVTADISRNVPVPMVATTTKQSSTSYLTNLNTRPVSTAPTSAGIPVPLASKFHPLPHPSQKGPLGGDYVFEVTLFKGTTGLGMNLAGGGSPDNPITIKKIASGTAADQCGQLRLGDVILEVNGKSVTLLSAKEVISILRACPSEVQLLAKRPGFQHFQQSVPATTSNYIGL